MNTLKGLFTNVGKSDNMGPLLCMMIIFTTEAGPQIAVVLLRVESLEFLTQAYGCLRGPLNPNPFYPNVLVLPPITLPNTHPNSSGYVGHLPFA